MNSASSQFFITIGDARQSLDGSYAGFGYIDEESMSVVYAIAEYMIPLTSNGVVTDKTKQPVITEVRVFEG
jgi:peptidyl-prolyl cis-trans isomerase B (cyclophilin B)